ncbi:MAG: hypothetical protein HYT12_02355 [Candidatus Liptonbacteria bacterium]|nr:hypothetical protein [Candidatus Liptonbacteria bacterium]
MLFKKVHLRELNRTVHAGVASTELGDALPSSAQGLVSREGAMAMLNYLKIVENDDQLAFATAWILDYHDFKIDLGVSPKHLRLRLLRNSRDPRQYLIFYNAMRKVDIADLPLPKSGNVIQFAIRPRTVKGRL